MGKKNKKFKKHVNTASSTFVQSSPSLTKEIDQKASEVATKMYREDLAKTEIDKDKILDAKYAFVRHDVKRLLFSLLILFIVMGGFYAINQKTSLLTTFGDWIYKIGHFSI